MLAQQNSYRYWKKNKACKTCVFLLPGQLDEKVAKLNLHALGAALCASRVPVYGILSLHVDALWEARNIQARTPETRMNVGKVNVGISRVASGLVFQTVNQALCVHRDVTRFLLWCGMDTSRTSFQILKLSNRVERELMDVVPSSLFCLLLVRLRKVQRARCLPVRCTLLVHQHAPMCPPQRKFYGRGCLLPTPSWTQRVLQVLTGLAYGMRRTGC